MRPDMHQSEEQDTQGRGYARQAADLDALATMGKWALIALLAIGAVSIALAIFSAWTGRV